MKEIIEHLGFGLLYATGGIVAVGVVLACVRKGGIVYAMVSAYMQSISG